MAIAFITEQETAPCGFKVIGLNVPSRETDSVAASKGFQTTVISQFDKFVPIFIIKSYFIKAFPCNDPWSIEGSQDRDIRIILAES